MIAEHMIKENVLCGSVLFYFIVIDMKVLVQHYLNIHDIR